MTHLRKMMLEELERRNYAQTTIVSGPLPSAEPYSTARSREKHHRRDFVSASTTSVVVDSEW
jgi:hypothetical protein